MTRESHQKVRRDGVCASSTEQLWKQTHIADVNNFFSNSVGGVVGYAVFAVVSRVPVLSSIVIQFRWQA